MGIFQGIILYIMIYWLALFAVLPFGNAPAKEVQEGNTHSAPENPRLARKFLITGIVSAVLWLIVFLAIYFGVIDFYDIARQMAQEDLTQ